MSLPQTIIDVITARPSTVDEIHRQTREPLRATVESMLATLERGCYIKFEFGKYRRTTREERDAWYALP